MYPAIYRLSTIKRQNKVGSVKIWHKQLETQEPTKKVDELWQGGRGVQESLFLQT